MLSICMIMKNEEQILEKTLAAIKPLNAEIVVVDTGSTDSSKEIAAKYTDNIYDFEWTGDFAAAKNYAADMASNDCILTLDADEVLTGYQIKQLEKCIDACTSSSDGYPCLGYITINNYFKTKDTVNTSSSNLPRIYSRKHYHYVGIIHEQLVPINAGADNQSNPRTIHSALKFDHYGYMGSDEFIKMKTDRNIELLNKMLEKDPEDTYVMYQIGKSYYMRGDYSKAYEVFDKCLYYDVDPKLEYVQDLVVSYAYSLINTEQYKKAINLASIYDEFSTCCEYVFVMGLIYMNNGLFDLAVKEFRKATTFRHCNIAGSNSYLANYNIGVIHECTGNIKAARNFYMKCKDYEPAAARLKLLNT